MGMIVTYVKIPISATREGIDPIDSGVPNKDLIGAVGRIED